MSFVGMDVEAALSHARRLEVSAASEVFRVLTAMQGIVPRLMASWHGEDARRFNDEWMHHAQSLSALHSELCDVSSSLSRAIAQQQRTSTE